MRLTRGIVGPALAASLLFSSAVAQSRTAQLRARFVQESSPVEKAKLMPRLGEGEFQDIRKEVAAGRPAEALAILEQYRAEAQLCAQGLDATRIDAEKHSAGFKQLQISLRQSLRRLNEILVGMTTDEQAPFLDVRKDLEELNRHLIGKLFPRQPVNGEPGKPEK